MTWTVAVTNYERATCPEAAQFFSLRHQLMPLILWATSGVKIPYMRRSRHWDYLKAGSSSASIAANHLRKGKENYPMVMGGVDRSRGLFAWLVGDGCDVDTAVGPEPTTDVRLSW